MANDEQPGDELAALVHRFVAGASLVEEAFRAAEDIDFAVPGEWSVREIMAHLADAEVVRAVRIRLILGEDEPLLPAFDENGWRERMAYAGADPAAALATYGSLVSGTAELLLRCPEDAFDRTGFHPSGEQLSVRTLVQRGIEHARDHVQQILQSAW